MRRSLYPVLFALFFCLLFSLWLAPSVAAAPPAPDETAAPQIAPPGDDGPGLDAPGLSAINMFVTITDGVSSVSPGQTLTYTLSVDNAGDSISWNNILTMTVPNSTAFVSCSNSCSVASGIVSWDLGIIYFIERTRSATFTINNPLPGGVTTIVARAGIKPNSDSNWANNVATDTDTVVSPADLQITVSDGGGSATPGSYINYTAYYTNSGGVQAQGVVMTQTLPANTTYAGSGWTSAGGGLYTRSIGNVNAGAAGSYSFLVQVNPVLPAGVASVTDTVTIRHNGAGGADPNLANNSASDSTPVSAAPDLRMTKGDGGVLAIPGGIITYSLVAYNDGNQDATGVVITETLPTNTTYAGAGWTHQGGSVYTRLVSSLAAGGSAPFAFVVQIANPLPAGVGTITNTVVVSDDGQNGADPTPANNAATDATAVDAAPDLGVFINGPASDVPGATVFYSLPWHNQGNQGATGVVLTATVPAHTTFNSSLSSPGWSCVAGLCSNAVGAAAGGGSSDVAFFAVTVDNPLPAGAHSATLSVGIRDDGTNGADSNPGDNYQQRTLAFNAAPDLVITKSDGGLSVVPGMAAGGVLYTLYYTNTGNIGATGVTVTDTWPVGLDQVSYSGLWSCASGACTYNVGGLPAGAAGSLQLRMYTISPAPYGFEVFTNTVAIGDDSTNGADSSPSDNTATETTPVNAAPNLAISITGGVGPLLPGDAFAYTINYSNIGDQDDQNVVVTATIPAHTTYNAAGSSAWVCAAGVCSYNQGNLSGVGGSGSLVLALTVATPLPSGVDNLAVAAGVTGAGTDSNPANNATAAQTPINAAPDLKITKTDNALGTTPGSVINYTLFYTNAGNQGATGVVITDGVPANTTFYAAESSAGWTCSDGAAAGASCTYSVGSLAAGASGSVLYAVRVDNPVPAGANSIANSASIGDDGANGPDPLPADNTAVSSTAVVAAPDLRIGKSSDGITPVPGGPLTYTIYYTNTGNVGINGAVITETVPAHTTFSALSSSQGWSCPDGAAAGTVCTINVGMLAGGWAASSVTFVVIVDNPLPPEGAIISNTVSVEDDGQNGSDPTPATNRATAILGAVITDFTKEAWVAPAHPGYAERYNITLHNTGVTPLNNVVISDTIPQETRFSEATMVVTSTTAPDYYAWYPLGGTWDGGRTVVWTLPTLEPGAYASMKVLVYLYTTVQPGVIMTNTAVMHSNNLNQTTTIMTATVGVPVAANPATPVPTHTATPTPTPPSGAWCPSGVQVRADSGASAAYTDSQGFTWLADQAYAAGVTLWGYTAGGAAYNTTSAIRNTGDPRLYQSERWWSESGGYRFDLPNGYYSVTLKFAEIYPYTTLGGRVFDVRMEGATVTANLDVMKQAGHYGAYDLTALAYVADGALNVDFVKKAGNPAVNALAVVGMEPCPATPTPSATPTSTATASATPDAPTATATATATHKPEQTATATQPAATATATPTQPGPTPTATAQPPATQTATPSPTATSVATPVIIPVDYSEQLIILTGDTAQGAALFNAYKVGAAQYENETGPEILYTFVVPQPAQMSASLQTWLTARTGDPDLFVLAAVDPLSGLTGGYGDTSVSKALPPGRYYLAVDGWNGWSGDFTLHLRFTPHGSPGSGSRIVLPLVMR